MAKHDESYVRLHNQWGVKTGQYIPPVPRMGVNTTIDLMRFRERIENEEGSALQWHNAFGRWNWTKVGTLSEYAQRSFNLSGQVHEESRHGSFFDSLQRRRHAGPAEMPEATYTRQTGLHFRRPLACESSFRLHNIDRSTQTTPESAGGGGSQAGGGSEKRRSAHSSRQAMPYYLRDQRMRNSWGPFSAPNLHDPGRNCTFHRPEH